ncbi:DUF2382 domain-containing protein [Kitasatospora sp. NPDC058201]|uniref:DUF2382 domain-containing protein n=1 Tax=unclassified Kitasatospora TaxID=2633591 RepID=UPI003669B42C
MQTDIDPRDLIGHKAVDRNGDKIGTVDEVYLDDATGRPEWAAVRTGIFGRDAFVPLTTSEFSGDELRVPYDKSLVKESPDFGVGQHLSPAQELQLYRYYGLDTTLDGQPSAGDGPGSGSEPADLDFGTTASNGTPADTPSSNGTPGTTASNGTPLAGVAGTAGAAAAAAAAARSRPATPSAAAPAKSLTFHTAAAAATTTPAAGSGKPADPVTEANVRTLATPTPAAAPPASTAATAPAAEPRPQSAQPAPANGTPPAASQPSPSQATPSATGTSRSADGAVASTPGGPVEITCREERLDVTTEWHVVGTAKLRKYVTSEPVERRVPVVRERVRVERMPVGEAERAALSEKDIAEAVEEVTLREERPVVRKYLAPIERVRLVVERYTAEEVIRDELRREHVEVHDTTGTASNPPVSASAASPGPVSPAPDEPARPLPLRPLV